MTKPDPAPVAVPPVVTEIGRRAQLKGLHLVRGSCELVGVLRPGQPVEELNVEMRGGADRHKHEAQTLICSFGVNVTAVGPKPEAVVVAKFSCDYAAQYFIEDKAFYDSLKDTDIAMFAAVNTSFHAWPHIREFVQSMSFRMTIPQVLLPMFRPGEVVAAAAGVATAAGASKS